MNKLALTILLLLPALTWAVIINGKKYELECAAVNSLLALGDYKAKLVKDEHRSPYDSYQVYEFLFPDNKTRKFLLVGQSE